LEHAHARGVRAFGERLVLSGLVPLPHALHELVHQGAVGAGGEGEVVADVEQFAVLAVVAEAFGLRVAQGAQEVVVAVEVVVVGLQDVVRERCDLDEDTGAFPFGERVAQRAH
jgi:hypothetical protein